MLALGALNIELGGGDRVRQRIEDRGRIVMTGEDLEQSRAGMATALDAIKKGGMAVTELSPAEVAKFREKVKPVIAKHSATVGEATVAEVMAELDKLRK